MPKKVNKLYVACSVIAVAAFVMQGVVIPKLSAEEITKTYKYLATTDNALPDDMADSFEQDGDTYVLPKDYESLVEIKVESEEMRHTETATITGLTSMQAPETKDFEVGDKQVTLVLESADYTPVERSYKATGEVEYPNQKNKPNAPETANISYETEDGDIITVEGTLVDITSSEGTGGATTNLESTIAMPAGSSTFAVGDKVITYDPASPRWNGYEEDIAKAVGLSNGQKVVGGTWSSKEYLEDGMMKRDVTWYIQGSTTSWTARYATEGTVTTYTANAVYSGSVEALGLDESFADEVKHTLSAEVPYVQEGSAQNNPVLLFFADNPKVLPAIGIIALSVLIVCFVISRLSDENKSVSGKNNDEDDDWLLKS